MRSNCFFSSNMISLSNRQNSVTVPVMRLFNPKTFGVCLLAAVLGGCALFDQKETVTLRIHEEVDTVMAGPRAMPVSMPNYDLTLSVDPQPALSEKYVKSAEIYPTAGGSAILIRFSNMRWVILTMPSEPESLGSPFGLHLEYMASVHTIPSKVRLQTTLCHLPNVGG